MSSALRISFVFIGEGNTDHGLREHLTSLCIDVGADEARGIIPDFYRLDGTNSLEDRLRAARLLEPTANLYFIHHDSDSPDPEPTYQMIERAIQSSQHPDALPYVAVVPIQETEAWLLLDEQSIRDVASKPRGRVPLNLPPAHRIEATASPKERLQVALIAASELQGRRLERFRADFADQRRILLERLPIGGPLERLTAWQRLRGDTAAAIAALRAAQAASDD